MGCQASDASEAINVVAIIKLRPQQVRVAEPVLKALGEASRREDGVNRYEIFRVRDKVG